MIPEIRDVLLSEVVFNQEIYPRQEHDPALVQRYLGCLEEIEARGNYMALAEDNTLLDGRHRHLAYLTKHQADLSVSVKVYVYPVKTEQEKYELAAELNSEHGVQLSEENKRKCAIDFWVKFHTALEDIAKKLRVRKEKVSEWTKTIRQEEERRLNEKVFALWLACHTQEEIAEETGLPNKEAVSARITVCQGKFQGTKSDKHSQFVLERDAKGEEIADEHGWTRPLYNRWMFAENSNAVKHPGNSDQRIVENLLYHYTEPFDIVLDPFAGGGSTIDVCKRRLRRYWVSDRAPIVGRAQEIRQLDVVKELPPLHKRWSEVTLTYLDPPYWRQMEGKYSKDPEDLANMTLEQFTDSLAAVINRIAAKQSKGFIALLMQPTQWKADNHQFTDHISDMVARANKKRLVQENRFSCPYSTEQCTPQMVIWAKAERKSLVLTRELVVWKVVPNGAQVT